MTSYGKQPINQSDGSFTKRGIKDIAKQSNEAIGLYIHWPFCVSKCPYCDFNSHVNRVFDDKDYVRAICQEIDHMCSLAGGRGETNKARPRISSIFFGGGTPSLMDPSSVAAILEHIYVCFELTPDVEVTLEANPSSVEADRFRAFGDAGINRVSLGVQALDDGDLQALGRAHTRSEALGAIKVAQTAFSRMSFDMIYGRHNQSLPHWRDELHRVIDLSVGHLSLYQLTIEPGTRYRSLFERGKLNLPDDGLAGRFFHETREICENAGLPAYEISNFAKRGEQSAHNLAYWRYRGYIGVGPGAHGRIARDGRRWASATLRSPRRWIEQIETRGHGLESLEELSPAEQADEQLLMGLRLVEGIDLARMRQDTGYAIDRDMIFELEAQGLCRLSSSGTHLQASEHGFGVLDHLLRLLSGAMDKSDHSPMISSK